ncbi:MAG: DUF433 domain-containing protein [bacterium]|nr:DUF433 domain-containing protein [bacterium]
MTVETRYRYVTSDVTVMGGEPVIRNTKTTVRAIIEMLRMYIAPEEIPDHLPHLTVADVFDALSYYADHQDEINHYIEINRVPDNLAHPELIPNPQLEEEVAFEPS